MKLLHIVKILWVRGKAAVKLTGKIVLGFFVCLPYIFDRKTTYLASVFSMGDTLIMGGLMPAFHARYPEKLVKVIVRETHRQITEFYQNEHYGLIFVSPFQAKLVHAFFNAVSRFSSRLCVCLTDKTLYVPDKEGVQRILSLGLIASYKRAFFLPTTVSFAAPQYPKPTRTQQEALAQKYGIVPGKTVILAPYSITLAMFDYTALFTKLADALKAEGYRVLTNTTDDRIIAGTDPLRADIHDLVCLAQDHSLWVISVRSGLCDLLRFADCRLSVLYPAEFQQRLFSLERMFKGRDRLAEMIVLPESSALEMILSEEDDNENTSDQ